MIPASGQSVRQRQPSSAVRVTCAMLGGVAAGVIFSVFTVPAAAVLLGWDTAVVIYLTWIGSSVWHLDSGSTARLAQREDPSSAVAELVIVGADTAVLVAVGFALVRAGHATGGMKAYLITLGVLSVVLSWTVVHAVYALRYARAYYSERPAASRSVKAIRRPIWTSSILPSRSG